MLVFLPLQAHIRHIVFFFLKKKKFITIERILIILILELKCISEFKILLLNYAFFYLTKTWFFLHHFF
jgi:hypothetical protein